jgi:hypothetical protein
VRRGASQALWGIEARRYRQHRDSDGHAHHYKKIEWTDQEVVEFGANLLSDYEKEWVVGEVLAWLQQVGGLIYRPYRNVDLAFILLPTWVHTKAPGSAWVCLSSLPA